MRKNHNKNKLAVICSSLLLVGIPLSSIAQTPSPKPSPVLNPRPSIFNEKLYNRNRTPVVNPTPNAPLVPPLPEESSNAIATVAPIGGKVSVKLTNTTNTAITYEAIEYTQKRTLAAKQEVVLKDLPAPVTLTLVRPDNGFIQIAATATTPGLLEVSLSEGKTLNEQQSAIRIQQNGKVFVN